MQSNPAIENSIVRIRDYFGKAVGLGFLAKDSIVLTCAHVVCSALGYSDPEAVTDKPNNFINIDFPFVQTASGLTAKIIVWQPYKRNVVGDIACLLIRGTLPHGVQQTPIAIKTELWKKPFRAFGIPQGYDNGVWVDGEILNRQSNGYFILQGTNSVGYRIQSGFSGGPIWIDQYQAVIGMLTLADLTTGIHAGFAVPARFLQEALQLAKSAHHQEKEQLNTNQFTPPRRLADLSRLSVSDLQQSASMYKFRAQHSQADSEDLLAAGLIAILQRSYTDAIPFLERYLTSVDDEGYALYALAIARMNGVPPRALANVHLANRIQSELIQATQRSSGEAHIWLLLHCLDCDYYERLGFKVQGPSEATRKHSALQGLTNRHEMYALANAVPNIDKNPLYATLWARS